MVLKEHQCYLPASTTCASSTSSTNTGVNPIQCGGGAPGAPPIIKMWFPEKCSKEEVLIFFDFS